MGRLFLWVSKLEAAKKMFTIQGTDFLKVEALCLPLVSQLAVDQSQETLRALFPVS